jgi:hypothetical protein
VTEGKQLPGRGGLKIILKLVYNGKDLSLHNQACVNEKGDSLYIDVLKYYLSNIRLKSSNGLNYAEKKSYHLVDAEDSASLVIYLTDLHEGSYTQLQFQIGVDSLANVSGALDGDLDPGKGMYWAWNSGYINAKLEGHPKVCHTLHQGFEFHIGGYLAPYRTIRSIALNIPELRVKTDNEPVLTIYCNVAKWLTDTDLTNTNSVLIPGKLAVKFADNYKEMFSLGR